MENMEPTGPQVIVPKIVTFEINVVAQQSPIILNTETASKSKTSFLFADFRATGSTATAYNTTLYVKPT